MIAININGLTLYHKGSSGISHNTLPDVCKTPGKGIPVPYQNEAYSSDLVKGTVSVFADGGNMIANVGSQFARSVFDEPGSMGGIKSGTNKAETDWISHSFDVFFEGKPACRLTDKMFMNHRNTVNMAGLCQDSLSEDDLNDLICKHALDCYTTHCGNIKTKDNPGGEYAHYQKCLEDKLREEAYNGNYPGENCKIWTEVHFDKNLDFIDSTSHPGMPSSRPFTPKGGRRMDIIQLDDSGSPTRLIDVKFPKDGIDKKRLKDYKKMAKKLGNKKYDTFDVTERCPRWPKECQNAKQTQESPQKTAEQEIQKNNEDIDNAASISNNISPYDSPSNNAAMGSTLTALLLVAALCLL